MCNNDTFLVFVYGSLRKHEGNHRLLGEAELVAAQCRTEGRLYDTGFGFPAMGETNSDKVYGELYRVTPEILRRLDALEGYYGESKNNHYSRVVRTIYTDSGTLEAFVYVYTEEKTRNLDRVELGDWKFHRMNQPDREWIYFAYGSCLDDERFKRSKVDHLFQNVIGRGVLNGYSLTFTYQAGDGGRADMMEIGGVVEGKAYRIGYEALEYLLRREGVHSHIYRPALVDIQAGDQIVKDALTFLVIDKTENDIPPPEHYLTEIRRGGRTVWSMEYERKFEENIRKLNSGIAYCN
jgi:gamma-glutamylcyclotransferase (GGCT)/AIG2-like uncharacterized protein YtfP/cation transport regulator ChaC